jgi:hypothetical protein
MNLAAILPRLPHVGFALRRARPPGQATAVVPSVRHMLSPHAILTLANRPLQLRVQRGCVWITRDGCATDTVLEAGEVFEQHPGARVLVQALEETEVLIAAAGAHAHNA